jgi:hypothetical protein
MRPSSVAVLAAAGLLAATAEAARPPVVNVIVGTRES